MLFPINRNSIVFWLHIDEDLNFPIACLKFILRGFSVASGINCITIVFHCLSVTHYLNISSMLWQWFDFYFHSWQIHIHEIKWQQIVSLRRRLWDLPFCWKEFTSLGGKNYFCSQKTSQLFFTSATQMLMSAKYTEPRNMSVNKVISRALRSSWGHYKKIH